MSNSGATTSPSRHNWGRILAHSEALEKAVNRSLKWQFRSFISVEDLVHQTYEYCYQRPQQWANIPDPQLIFYLRKVASFFLRNKFRELRNHREVFVGSNPVHQKSMEEKLTATASPSKVIHKREKNRVVKEIMSRLQSPEQREILRLVWMEGLQMRDAAARMGCSRVAGYSLFKRAMDTCRKIAQRSSFEGFRVSGETC